MRVSLTTFVLVAGLFLCAGAEAHAQDKVFNKPLFNSDRLDWCLTWGANCGKPAADTFCTRRRFTGARQFSAEVVGRSATTRLIGTNQVCQNADFCTAFAAITCTGPIPSERVFANPVWKNQRLDVCLQFGANCGTPAADAFCKAQGFAGSFAWVADPEPGRSTTRIISNDQICSGSFCVGFQQIICR